MCPPNFCFDGPMYWIPEKLGVFSPLFLVGLPSLGFYFYPHIMLVHDLCAPAEVIQIEPYFHTFALMLLVVSLVDFLYKLVQKIREHIKSKLQKRNDSSTNTKGDCLC